MKCNAGFTLIEILLVVIIMGVLAALVTPRLAGRSEEARMQAAKADIDGGIALALDLYEVDNGHYPSKLEDLITLPENSVRKAPYLKKGLPKDPWGSSYVYQFPGTRYAHAYDLASPGPDKKLNSSDDVLN